MARDGLLERRSMAIAQSREQYSNTKVVSGKAVSLVFRMINNGRTRDEVFAATAERVRALRAAGYRVIENWECQEEKTRDPLPKREMRT